jgi:hypothetical protein
VTKIGTPVPGFPTFTKDRSQEVWSLPVTEQMREKALYEGMPMYQMAVEKPTERKLIQPSINIDEIVENHINTKYADILEIETEDFTDDVLAGIDDATISPEDLDKYLKKADNTTIERAKSVIADQLGELIETYKYEGQEDGEKREKYLDSLLDVVSKAEMRDIHTKDKTQQAQAGRISAGTGANFVQRTLFQQARTPNIRYWVASKGGVNPDDKTWKGELDNIRWKLSKSGQKTQAEGFPKGFWNGKLSLDDLTATAVTEGWLPPGSTDQDLLTLLQQIWKTLFLKQKRMRYLKHIMSGPGRHTMETQKRYEEMKKKLEPILTKRLEQRLRRPLKEMLLKRYQTKQADQTLK